MKIHQSNLLLALSRAIEAQEGIEKNNGYTRDSIYLGGLRDMYKHVKEGGQINIIPSND